MQDSTEKMFIDSWLSYDGLYEISDILEWVKALNEQTSVSITKTMLHKTGWFYEQSSGQIVNNSRSFFQVSGFCQTDTQKKVYREQPIIIQDEIGYLGILSKNINGTLHFLMQAKIEPGNINKIQISPTIQATKSNFMQRHGGSKPAYLDYFVNARSHRVIVDQIQSEQSSRFLKKRNRNIIVMVDDSCTIEESRIHRWMTLGQIKRLMRFDNLVNMDTRTVLSNIPFQFNLDTLKNISEARIADNALFRSIIEGGQSLASTNIYNHINDYKMYSMCTGELVPLFSLKNWSTDVLGDVEEFHDNFQSPFKVIFCDISIDGREVRNWGQPLLEAIGIATFGLFTTVDEGVRYFLVRTIPEIGCFDSLELGPTVQVEAGHEDMSPITDLFFRKYRDNDGVMYNVKLSEEGGRFYHEQNNNVIIEIGMGDLPKLPESYFWLTYNTLNRFVQINNCLNIQLRNLLSLLEL